MGSIPSVLSVIPIHKSHFYFLTIAMPKRNIKARNPRAGDINKPTQFHKTNYSLAVYITYICEGYSYK